MLLDGIPFRLGPYRANGFSVGSRATWITVPTFDLCLDMGWCVEAMRDLPRVFISHLHQDHCLGLPIWLDWRQGCIATRGLPQIFLPAPSAEPARRWLDAAAAAQHMGPLRCELIPLRDGDQVELGGHFLLEAFETTHHTPTIGAIVAQRLRRLKPEFEGLSGDAVSALFERGVDIHDLELRPMLAYTSDTTPEVFERRPELLRAQVLVVECSLVDGALLDGTRSSSVLGERPEISHCHVRPLSRVLDRFEGEHLVLCHVPPHFVHADLEAFLLPRFSARQRSKLALIPYRPPSSEPPAPAAPSPRPTPFEPAPLETIPPDWERLPHDAPPDLATRTAFAVGDRLLTEVGMQALVDASYLRLLSDTPELLAWLTRKAADVFVAHDTDLLAGASWPPNALTTTPWRIDVAIRRALLRLGRWFEGSQRLHVSGSRSEGFVLDPGVVPFAAPEWSPDASPPHGHDIWVGSVAHALQSTRCLVRPAPMRRHNPANP